MSPPLWDYFSNLPWLIDSLTLFYSFLAWFTVVNMVIAVQETVQIISCFLTNKHRAFWYEVWQAYKVLRSVGTIWRRHMCVFSNGLKKLLKHSNECIKHTVENVMACSCLKYGTVALLEHKKQDMKSTLVWKLLYRCCVKHYPIHSIY